MKNLTFTLTFVLGFLLFVQACSDSNSDNGEDEVITSCNVEGELAQSSNSEVEAMRQAMLTFRNSLSTAQLSELSNCLDDERFYLWHNTPNAEGNSRDGIIYGDLSSDQLDNFKAIMELFLSTSGYKKVDDISTLAEGYLSDQNSGVWDNDYYSIDLFGDPENSGSWGFQVDGHHLAINFLVHGDYVSIVPAFLGAEPASETYSGIEFDIFADERDLALELYHGLSPNELSDAVSTGSREMQVGPASQPGSVDPYRGDYNYSGFETGLKYSEMSSTTQANLILVMQEYVNNLTTTFADLWWEDILDNIDDTYFVWIDNVDTPTVTTQFYYRIYNPYLWIEFNTENVVGGNIEDWNHIHTITRIPNNPSTNNGGDYGIFALLVNSGGIETLYDHYALAEHHNQSNVTFDYEVIQRHDHGHSTHTH